jgi:peptidyl-prolyl cis-trans isomerase D
MSKQYTANSIEKLKRGLSGKSIGAIVLFGAIIATFIFADFSPRATGGGGAATVNGRIISLSEFQNEVEIIEQYYKQVLGNSMDFSSQRQLLQRQALEYLVRNELVFQGLELEHI